MKVFQTYFQQTINLIIKITIYTNNEEIIKNYKNYKKKLDHQKYPALLTPSSFRSGSKKKNF